MKRWIAVMAICFAVVLLGGGGPPPSWGTPLITFTDNGPGGLQAALGSDGNSGLIFYASWTQTVATTNTTIEALLSSTDINTAPGTVWLTNAVGLGATPADVIASNTFTAPVIYPAPADIDNLPLTTLFSGLDLGAGTYYLVLQGPVVDPSIWPPYWWLGDFSDVAVTTASGFSVGPYAHAFSPDGFPPSSIFTTEDSNTYLFYRVDGTVVPLPPTLLLLGSGLLGLAGWRRFRES
jgi:hypothetical protein